MLVQSALVARGSFVLCEYDASTGSADLNEVSRKVLSKIPRTGSIRSYVYAGFTFNYLLEKDLIFLCIADVAAGSELVFQFLGEFKMRHEQCNRLGGTDRSAELTRMLRDLISNYNSEKGGGKVRQMEQELEDVTEMMRDNISKVMERGERIESLIDKTALLKNESVSFRAGAQAHNDKLWWRDNRGRIILAVLAAIVLIYGLWSIWRSHAASLEARMGMLPAPSGGS